MRVDEGGGGQVDDVGLGNLGVEGEVEVLDGLGVFELRAAQPQLELLGVAPFDLVVRAGGRETPRRRDCRRRPGGCAASRVCSSPDRRSFLRIGTKSSVELMVILPLSLSCEQLGRRAGEARARAASAVVRAATASGQRFAVERLAQDVAHAAVGVIAEVAGARAGGAGALGRKLLEMRDDGLHGAQLAEHVVGGEDLADVRADLGAEPLGALHPEARLR